MKQIKGKENSTDRVKIWNEWAPKERKQKRENCFHKMPVCQPGSVEANSPCPAARSKKTPAISHMSLLRMRFWLKRGGGAMLFHSHLPLYAVTIYSEPFPCPGTVADPARNLEEPYPSPSLATFLHHHILGFQLLTWFHLYRGSCETRVEMI